MVNLFFLQIFVIRRNYQNSQTHKSAQKSVWLKVMPTGITFNIYVSYQHIINRLPIIWLRFLIHLGIVDLFSSSNLCYQEALLEFSNLQISSQLHLVGIKPTRKFPIFSVSYQHVMNKLPTHLRFAFFFESLLLRRIFRILKSTNQPIGVF